MLFASQLYQYIISMIYLQSTEGRPTAVQKHIVPEDRHKRKIWCFLSTTFPLDQGSHFCSLCNFRCQTKQHLLLWVWTEQESIIILRREEKSRSNSFLLLKHTGLVLKTANGQVNFISINNLLFRLNMLAMENKVQKYKVYHL